MIYLKFYMKVVSIAILVFGLAYFLGLARSLGQTSSGEDEEYDCLIEPHSVIKIGSPVEGIVDEVAVDRGDTVAKGQEVARLKSGVEEAAVALARARAEYTVNIQSSTSRLAYERRKLSRARKLSANNIVAESALDEARTETSLAEMAVAEAEFGKLIANLELGRAEELLAQRSIRSPVDGVIVERLLWPGEYAHERAEIVTIAQMDPLNVEAFVPISMFVKIGPGIEAKVRPEEPIGGVYTAKVDVVDVVFDAASGTFGVRMLLPNPERDLPAGLKCKVQFGLIAE